MRDRWTLGLGIVFLGLALVALLVWIPRDIETGVVEVFRRTRSIGDAMAPVVAAVGVAAMGLVLVATSFLAGEDAGGASGRGRLSADNGIYFSALVAILAVSLAIMYWAGPASVAAAKALGADMGSYRTLRGTLPWKYIGYMLGGTTLVCLLIGLIERRLTPRNAMFAAAITLILAMLYDLPFDNLLLPPNGDY